MRDLLYSYCLKRLWDKLLACSPIHGHISEFCVYSSNPTLSNFIYPPRDLSLLSCKQAVAPALSTFCLTLARNTLIACHIRGKGAVTKFSALKANLCCRNQYILSGIILEMNLVCYKFLPPSKWTNLATHMLVKLESAQITEGFR